MGDEKQTLKNIFTYSQGPPFAHFSSASHAPLIVTIFMQIHA